VTPFRVAFHIPFVPGLVPGIHAFFSNSKGVDGRDERGHERNEG
jgi:hypothetical protein